MQTRQPNYNINPLILNILSPWSMTGEQLNDDTILWVFLRLQGEHHLLMITIYPGYLSMPREILFTGINFSIC